MGTKIDMIGKRFGRWVVIAEGEKIATRRTCRWICKCDCGTITESIDGSKLRSGETKSCGCYKRDVTVNRNYRHGLCYTRIHSIWVNMKDRCYNPNNHYFHRYGGRGITVCNEWLNSLETFYDWAIANGYADTLTIDRIDVNGSYCPENCRWATDEMQANNREKHILLEINGETKNIAQWAKESGLKYRTIHARYNRGWTGESLIRKV